MSRPSLTLPLLRRLTAQMLTHGLSNKILAAARKQREEIENEERQEEIGRSGPTKSPRELQSSKTPCSDAHARAPGASERCDRIYIQV